MLQGMGKIQARVALCLVGEAEREIWERFCLETYRKQHPGEEGVTSNAALKIYPGQNHMAAVKQELLGSEHESRGSSGIHPPAEAASQPLPRPGSCSAGLGTAGRAGDSRWPPGSHLLPAARARPHGPAAIFG